MGFHRFHRVYTGQWYGTVYPVLGYLAKYTLGFPIFIRGLDYIFI
nr:MAG TPA: hypothetical protein [Caudoviricetes sp.]